MKNISRHPSDFGGRFDACRILDDDALNQGQFLVLPKQGS